MTDRDELATLMEATIFGQMTSNGVDERRDAYWLPIADAILARWRLVPIEEQQSYEARQAMLCGCGGMGWDGHIGGCPHAQPDPLPTETP